MDQDAGGGRAPSKLPNLVVAASKHQQPAAPVDERLRHLEPRMIEAIESEMVGPGDNTITWDDIAGLEHAKQSINEAIILPMLRPDIFNGLRAPPKGVLLYGPPGTGKTLLAKCIARQCRTSFFSISSSSLTSKWIGDGEKMVKCLFAVARVRQPAVIFVDELDSLLSSRTEGENDSARRMKTEFLIQFDGCATSESDRVLVIGATNRPGELDDAARRRFRKKLYIPLPNKEARKRLLKNLLLKVPNNLTEQEIDTVCDRTEGYSGSDLDQTVREAALGPIRNMAFEEIEKMAVDQLRPVSMADFDAALTQIKASVSPKDLAGYEEFEKMFGSSRS
ncbi:P-loop containing nucleoside triphosphate hydrolase protein [Hyaloraphidium curvatum]|nr:P-loop containing nucleoside triphosphate hydrolase protein [Hyaloraphidium curvatum]